VKGRLVDAAKAAVLGKEGGAAEGVDRVVRYLARGTAGAAGAGLVGPGMGREEEERRRKEKEGEKLGEVEVTGFELEKVLKCETGKKKVDKVRYFPLPWCSSG